jgi:methylenetetrahydrofolate dehydrogenase (NADP+) / methenyltetrahydrofolate cyclohydrolase
MGILDGTLVAKQIKDDLKSQIDKMGRKPRLAVCLVGNDPASKVYVSGKQKACAAIGIETELRLFDKDVGDCELIEWICEKNECPDTSGILIQLPLPESFDRNFIFSRLDPAKDVDCFHPANRGLLDLSEPRFLPCTPAGIIEILNFYEIPIKGSHVVIVNRSIVVGQPLAILLSQNTSLGNATVTLCHEYTRGIGEICRSADILVTAVGKRPSFILSADMVKCGAVVIDVGITRQGGKITGDADFENVSKKTSWITPVPGGVGPLTICFLMKNVLKAHENQSHEHRLSHKRQS